MRFGNSVSTSSHEFEVQRPTNGFPFGAALVSPGRAGRPGRGLFRPPGRRSASTSSFTGASCTTSLSISRCFARRGLPPAIDLRRPTLFAGAGREDALRVVVGRCGAGGDEATASKDAERQALHMYVRDLPWRIRAAGRGKTTSSAEALRQFHDQRSPLEKCASYGPSTRTPRPPACSMTGTRSHGTQPRT